MVQHRIHVALEAGADIIGVHSRDEVARDVGCAAAPADVSFERLQTA